MPFQSTINIQPALAVAGDFASANPRKSLLAGAGAFVAGAAGLTVGLFVWHDTVDDTKLNNNAASGVPCGFLHRGQTQLITTFLAENGGLIQPGTEVNAMIDGDFWVKHEGASAVTRNMKAFAQLTTGKIQFAAAGATIAGWVETKWFAHSTGAAGELIKMSSISEG